MRTLLILALLAPLPASAGDLTPVRQVAEHLDAGTRAWLAGKPLAGALLPWQASTRGEEGALEAELRDAGVARLELVATELEFNLEGPEGHLDVRAVVSVTPEQIALLEVRAMSESRPDGLPLQEAGPAQTQIAKAALALGNRLLQPDCAAMPVLDPATRWPDAPFLEQAQQGAERTKAQLPGFCATVLGAEHRVTHFHADDLAFLARGPEGEYIGLISGELEFDGGGVQVQFQRFERLEPQDKAPQEPAVESAPRAPDPLTAPGP